MVVPAATRSNSNDTKEMRRMARKKNPENPEPGKKKPFLGTGGHGNKAGKEIPGNKRLGCGKYT